MLCSIDKSDQEALMRNDTKFPFPFSCFHAREMDGLLLMRGFRLEAARLQSLTMDVLALSGELMAS